MQKRSRAGSMCGTKADRRGSLRLVGSSAREMMMRARQHRPVAAVLGAVAMLAVAGCGGDDDDSSTATTESSTTTTEAPDDGATTVAKGEDVEIGGFGGLAGQTLNITAVEEDGEVTGEFRVNNVVVTLQCAGTEFDGRDLILGGQVTDDPDGQGLVADVGDATVAVGDRLALIIREDDPDSYRVTLYANVSAGSCTELVESVPFNLDGGFFSDVEDGYDVVPG